MLKEGIKKELMFFTRSFRMWGVALAAVIFAISAPLIVKLSYEVFSRIETAIENTNENASPNDYLPPQSFGADIIGELSNEEGMARLGSMSSLGDLTGTLLLIFMLVIMYTAGGELKKRSMIIPLNAGLNAKLYVLPKFILYPLCAAIFAFFGVFICFILSSLIFSGKAAPLNGILASASAAAVYDAFVISLYLTLGLCTAKAGMAVAVIYCSSAIISPLFSALGADKFHPFTLTNQAARASITGEIDALNLFGSMGITVLIIILCYFLTLFVISAKKIDNRGETGPLL